MTRVVNIAQSGGNNVTMRNKIINGAMMIDQRNAGASVTTATSGAYNLDRWNNNNNSGASRFTVQQTPSATETGYITRVSAGFSNYMACTSTGAYSIGSSDVLLIRQIIEANNIADLAWGTSGAKNATLSFWVYSSLTGTFGGSLKSAASGYSYPFSYTINSANTWEQKTITIAGPTGGTWNTGNSAGLEINFGIGVGSTYSGTAGSWASADYRSSTGATSVVGTNGATWYITGVQFEAGTTATPFEQRLYGTELALCQRYYYKWLNDTGAGKYVANIQAYSSAAVYGKLFDFPVPMRSTPTCSRSGTITVFNAVSSPAGNPSVVSLTESTRFSMGSGDINTGLSGLVAGNCSVISMANNGFFDASAEL